MMPHDFFSRDFGPTLPGRRFAKILPMLRRFMFGAEMPHDMFYHFFAVSRGDIFAASRRMNKALAGQQKRIEDAIPLYMLGTSRLHISRGESAHFEGAAAASCHHDAQPMRKSRPFFTRDGAFSPDRRRRRRA